eukprot:RCo006672
MSAARDQIPGLRTQRSGTPPPSAAVIPSFIVGSSHTQSVGAAPAAPTFSISSATSSGGGVVLPHEDIRVSQEDFEMDACEVFLIGVKGTFMPFNDNCRSKKLFTCGECRAPVITFGRLLNCKHLFCHTCAMRMEGKPCPKCGELVASIQTISIDKEDVCVCEYNEASGPCLRSYVSEEDLFEHQRLRGPPAPPREEDLMATFQNAKAVYPREGGGYGRRPGGGSQMQNGGPPANAPKRGPGGSWNRGGPANLSTSGSSQGNTRFRDPMTRAW